MREVVFPGEDGAPARYYAPGDPGPRPFLAPADKEGELRVVAFGESSVWGWPFAAEDAFPAKLEPLLRARLGARPVRVVNAGVDEENSTNVLGRVRAFLALRPDWVVLYFGHNDGSRVAEIMRPGAAWTRAAGRLLRRSRLYEAIAERVVRARIVYEQIRTEARFGPGDAPRIWRALPKGRLLAFHEAWPWSVWEARPARPGGRWDDLENFEAARAILLDRYRDNLSAMIREARARGARAIVMTLASRLRDNPPRTPGRFLDLPPEARAAKDALLSEGGRRLAAGEAEEAAARLREALAIDPTDAAAHYGLARALDALGRPGEAEAEYVLAKDWDLAAERAHSAFNRVARETAAREGALLVDLEAILLADPDCGGAACFHDRIHPSRALHGRIAEILAAAIAEAEARAPSPPAPPHPAAPEARDLP